MTIMNVTNDYDNATFTNFTNTEKEDIIMIFNFLVLSLPSSILLFFLISLMVYTLVELLFNNK